MAVTLDLAISAIRSGRKEEGRQLLNILIQQDPNNDKAWLWMSSVVYTDEQRARCLYHVLAIDPANQLARKGLQLLGITVSDSRPVQVPRDSQPIQIPKPSQPAAEPAPQPPQPAPPERRPFLINPHVITQPMRFTPGQPHPPEPVKASPEILSIKLDDDPEQNSQPEAEAEATPEPASSSNMEPQQAEDAAGDAGPQEATGPGETLSDMFVAGADTRYTETQKMVAPDDLPNASQERQAVDEFKPVPAQPASDSKPAQPQNGTVAPGDRIPNETRPSQPIPVTPPNQMTYGGGYPGYTPNPNHVDPAMGMPNPQQYAPQANNYPMLPSHSQATMGMPMQPNDPRPPSEPISPVHSSSTLGMMPQPYPQPFHNSAFHSNATMMMPTMSYEEARARLASGQIPATDASAMPLQNGSSPFNGYGNRYMQESDLDYDDEDEDDEINILAVIIFGTLSITALGGFGMLILLVFTAPPV